MIGPGGKVVVGVKGKSGRKSAPVEFAKAQAIIKAWNKINAEIDSEDVSKVALPIALRDMTERKDITSGDKPISILANVSSNHGNSQNNGNVQENTSITGGNFGEQDSINNLIPD